MRIETTHTDDAAVIHLTGRLDIEHARELASILRSELDERPRITVNAEQLDSCDIACLQVLCSAHRYSRGLGKKFMLAPSGSGTLQAASERAGFTGRPCTTVPCLFDFNELYRSGEE